jgi:hypothetical protein
MKLEDIKILNYKHTGAKKFGYWVNIRDYRKVNGNFARKTFINFLQQTLGPLGVRWQYQRYSHGEYVIKFNDEKDLLIFLLKANRD